MRLKKVWRKDKQQQMSLQQSGLKTPHSAAHRIALYQQLKSNMLHGSQESCPEQLILFDLTQRQQLIDQSTQLLIDHFTQLFTVETSSSQTSNLTLSQLDRQITYYFSKIMKAQSKAQSDLQLWSKQQLLTLGQQLIKSIEKNNDETKFDKKIVNQLTIFNNAVCYTQLHMLQQALSNLKKLETSNQNLPHKLKYHLQCLKNIVAIKMGKPFSSLTPDCPSSSTNSKKNQRIIQKQTEQFLTLVKKSKQQLIHFITKDMQTSKMHISNVFNLALLCKRYKMPKHAAFILECMRLEPKVNAHPSLIKKVLVLLSKIYQEIFNFQQSINNLQRIDSKQEKQLLQINLQIWQLKKKQKLSKVISVCPDFEHCQSKQYQMLQNLQSELDKLTKHDNSQQAASGTFRNISSTPYRSIGKRKINARKSLDQVYLDKALENQTPKLIKQPSTNLFPPQLKKHQQSLVSIPLNKLFSSDASELSKKKFQNSKKTIKFHPQPATVLSASYVDLIYDAEEKIMSAIMQQKKAQAMDQIKIILEQLVLMQSKIPVSTLNNFKLKCNNWCRQLKEYHEAENLLQSFLSSNSCTSEFRVTILKQLQAVSEERNDYKKAVKVSLELVSLGQIQFLDKAGELNIAKQNYSDAIQNYELYYQLKRSTYSLLKLAHAYSKVCTHIKKAIDILVDLLFENKNNGKFKNFEPEDHEHIQNAVLLLSSIYINGKGVKKAQEICEKYVSINFSAYPVYHLLGIIHNQNDNPTTAFNYFINALKLKPNHLPSLLEIIRHIGPSHSNNSQIITILRKAFICNHRNWELLQLLVEVISNSKRNNEPISLKRLIEYAQLLEEAGGQEEDLTLEAEIVWLWALQYLQRKKNYLHNNQQQQTVICIRLGEITLKKGDYHTSQTYFKKVLQKLQSDRMLTAKRKLQNIKLQLQVLDRLSFIKLQQQRKEQALDHLRQSQNLARDNDLQIWIAQITNKISHLQATELFY